MTALHAKIRLFLDGEFARDGGSTCAGTTLLYAPDLGVHDTLHSWAGGALDEVSAGARWRYADQLATEIVACAETEADGRIVGQHRFVVRTTQYAGAHAQLSFTVASSPTEAQNSAAARPLAGIERLPISSAPGPCILHNCDHAKHAAADRGLIQPGQMVPLAARPSRSVRPSVLLVAAECAPHFTIDDVQVGARSQNPLSQSLPALRFSAETLGGEWVIDRCDADTPLVMNVTNTSAEPRIFSGTWQCDELPRANTKYLVHDTRGVLLAPGQRCSIMARAQRTGVKPRHLYIPPDIARHFQIEDVRLNNRLQGVVDTGLDAIPATKFSHGSGAPFTCETLGVAMDFMITVTNTSTDFSHFVGVWACDVDDSQASLPDGMPQDAVDRLAAAVVEKLNGPQCNHALYDPRPGGNMPVLHGPILLEPPWTEAQRERIVRTLSAELSKDAVPLEVASKEPSRAEDYDIGEHLAPASAMGSVPERREPLLERKDRKGPSSFGWDPWSVDE